MTTSKVWARLVLDIVVLWMLVAASVPQSMALVVGNSKTLRYRPGIHGGRASIGTTTTTTRTRSTIMTRYMAPFTLDPTKTALVLIEYQNEFTTPGGKLHDAVKDVMEKTNSEWVLCRV